MEMSNDAACRARERDMERYREVTVQLVTRAAEDCLAPTPEAIERALTHSTAHEALETALCCDVALSLSPVSLQDMAELLTTLADYLKGSHQIELENEHFGDDSCSYCEAIAKAREMALAARKVGLDEIQG